MPIPAGKKVKHPASAGGQPVSADAWITAQKGTHKRQNLGAEVGVDFLYSAPCSHKAGMANRQAPLPWSFCPSLSNMIMPSWDGGSALSYQIFPSLWNDAAESDRLEIKWTLKHGEFHFIYGYSLKQGGFSRSGARRVLVKFLLICTFFPPCVFFIPAPLPIPNLWDAWDRSANRTVPVCSVFSRNRILL